MNADGTLMVRNEYDDKLAYQQLSKSEKEAPRPNLRGPKPVTPSAKSSSPLAGAIGGAATVHSIKKFFGR